MLEADEGGVFVSMTFEQVYAQLEAWGSERGRAINARQGAGDNQFGALMGDVRRLAKSLKTQHELGQALWATGNMEAQILASMIMDPRRPSEAELEAMLRGLSFYRLVDELTSKVVADSPHADALRQRWVDAPEDLVGRAGWNLMVARVGEPKKAPLDLPAVLARIEAELVGASEHRQWAMNHCLVEIAVRHPEHREACIAMAERLGVYVDQKVAKGCTSAYAPAWIAAVVNRKQAR